MACTIAIDVSRIDNIDGSYPQRLYQAFTIVHDLQHRVAFYDHATGGDLWVTDWDAEGRTVEQVAFEVYGILLRMNQVPHFVYWGSKDELKHYE
ncbi:hypothetical protein FF1_007931 [Malus domestica]